MRTEAAAKRYAQAAFAVALEGGDPERWLGDLDAIVALVARPEVAALLESDRVPGAQKDDLLRAAMPDVGQGAMSLARLLVAKRRTNLVEQIRQGFRDLLDDHKGLARASVTTAIPLTDEQAKEIAAKLSGITGKQVTIEPSVNPDILGGLIARIGDTLIDGSTRSRLLALKKELQGAG